MSSSPACSVSEGDWGAGASAGPRIPSALSQEPVWVEVTPSAAPDKPCALGGFASQVFPPSCVSPPVEVGVGPAPNTHSETRA